MTEQMRHKQKDQQDSSYEAVLSKRRQIYICTRIPITLKEKLRLLHGECKKKSLNNRVFKRDYLKSLYINLLFIQHVIILFLRLANTNKKNLWN